MADLKPYLLAAMNTQGLTDNDERAGIAGICMGESNMAMHVETGYSHTSNERIREVFPSLTEGLGDAALDQIKATDESWFNFVYGPQSSTGRELGNTQPGDGYMYRGRGFIQLTGRANYTRYANAIHRPDVIQNPDLALQPDVSAALTVAYIKDRYHGGGFSALLRCVGNNTPDIEATKTRDYEAFKQSGEFDWDKVATPAAPTPEPPVPEPAPVPQPAPVVSEKPSLLREVLDKVEALVRPSSASNGIVDIKDMVEADIGSFQTEYAQEFGLSITGKLDKYTTTAWIHVFQRAHPPLYDDGVMGPTTLDAYQKAYGHPYA